VALDLITTGVTRRCPRPTKNKNQKNVSTVLGFSRVPLCILVITHPRTHVSQMSEETPPAEAPAEEPPVEVRSRETPARCTTRLPLRSPVPSFLALTQTHPLNAGARRGGGGPR
jgi:hypothetical protein